MNQSMLIFDASNFAHRAFNVAQERVTSQGEHVGALYLTIKMIRNVANHFRANHVATVFDAPGDTFRHIIYPAYKAHRDPHPPEFTSQLEALQEVVDAMGLNPLSVPGVEGDDVIGTLGRACDRNGVKCAIATNDKDFAALVTEHVQLLDPDRNLIGVEEVKAKYGVPPELITDFLTLQGDNSDNIPGVALWGGTTAAKWLNQYGSLVNLVKHADEINGKAGENLRNSIDQLFRMREVVKLRDELKMIKEPELYPRKPLDKERLLELFRRFEFHDMARKLTNGNQPQRSAAPAYPGYPS